MLDICTTTTNHNKTQRLESQSVFFSFSLRRRHMWVNDCQPSWWRALIPRYLISAIKAANTSYFHSCLCLYPAAFLWDTLTCFNVTLFAYCTFFRHRDTHCFSLKSKKPRRSKLSLDLEGRLRIMRSVWAENWIFIRIWFACVVGLRGLYCTVHKYKSKTLSCISVILEGPCRKIDSSVVRL